MGNTAKYCGGCNLKETCINSRLDNNDLRFEEGGFIEESISNIGTNPNDFKPENIIAAKHGNLNLENQINMKNESITMENIITEDIQANGTEINKLKENFDERLLEIAQKVDESKLDDLLKNQIAESERLLEGFKKESKYNKAYFGLTVEKPLVRLNFDESYYKGDWKPDLKRHGFGIWIKKDYSRYEGTWENDMINGFGRFTGVNGNYYEGNRYF